MALQIKAIASRESRVGEMFSALYNRNFRLFWAGAFLSNTGTWMQTVAQGWLVLKLTDSPFWLGFDGFMATVPGLLLTLLAGVFADLVDRKRLLIYTQIGAGLSALMLALLVVTNLVEVWMILVLSFATGCCMALSGPSYQAITSDLVSRRDLANAIALNSTQFQLSRVVGPLLAGLGMKAFGLAGSFFINGISYAAIVVALARVDLAGRRPGAGASVVGEDEPRAPLASSSPSSPPGTTTTTTAPAAAATMAVPHSLKDRRALWHDLLEGFRYVRHRPRVRVLLLCSAVTSLFGAPYLVLIPLFARNIFEWGETGLALMMGTAGAGALCGALLLAFLGDFRGKGWFVLGSAFSASVCLITFALATRPLVSLTLLFGVGFSMVCFFAVTNTLLQQLVSDEMRGRVMSIWILTFIGTMPFGSFFAGIAAETFGAPWTIATGGLVIAGFTVFVGFRNARLRQL